MTSRARIVYLIGFLVGLTVLNFVVAKGFTIPVGDTALWLHSGLLTLVLGAYWIESHFPSPSDVAVNALVVFMCRLFR